MAARWGEKMASPADLGVERTLVLLKPDAVARGLAGRVLVRSV
jgi:nucleoside-diphosphate kinase